MKSKRTKAERIKAARKLSHRVRKGNLPTWLTTFSNRILPPLFFVLLAAISLHYLPAVTKTSLRINLGIVTVTSSTLAIYITSLIL